MTQQIVSQDWFVALIEECGAIMTERSFNARWETIQCYHEIGSRILTENENFKRSEIYGKQIVHLVAESLERSERAIYYAIEFAKMFPDIEKLPDGKSITWSKICKNLLTTGETSCAHDTCEDIAVRVCKKCHKKLYN